MRGEVVYLFAFDVANEIAMPRVSEILGRRAFPFDVPVDHSSPKDAPLYRPLTTEPVEGAVSLGGRPVRIHVRVYEVGVVNVAMHVPCDVQAPEELAPFHAGRTDDGRRLDEVARELCREVCTGLGPALVRGAEPSEPEAYTIFALYELGDEQDAGAWLAARREAVASLLGDARGAPLSGEQIDESLRIRRAYSRRDLVVIDWDASLVIELDGRADDVLYALELANLQLEEYRVMDARLDRHAEAAYRDLDRPRSLWFGGAQRTLAWLRRFRVDAAKLADEVSHITKFFGDWHLARVYLGASERFHLAEWQHSIERRLGQLDEVYRVLQSDLYERRMLWLEVAVVVCFVIDLLGLFFWKR